MIASMTKSLITLSLLSTLTMACTRPSARQVRNDVAKSVQANTDAKTLSDWENSDDNNEVVFKRWKEAEADPEEVCKGLLDKDAKDLVLFEEEIKSKDYETLIAPCKKELLQKMEDYWSKEKKKMQEIQSSFTFPDNVQTRDVSRGYKTISGDIANKEIILTFDDGPHPVHTDKILKALADVNAKAIFFTMGKNSKAYPSILRRVADGGHAIGTHSVDHKCLPAKKRCASNNGRMLTYSEAVAEIRGGHQAVKDILGWVDPFFRFPYGESSPELSEYLKEHSVGEFYWSVDSEDWKNRTPAEMLKRTMDQIEAKGRGHVLFHDIQRRTAEALPLLLKQLYYKGYSIVLIQSANPKDRYNSKLVN
ncbi:polysaccharide deacetylase family protein [Bdellovibrio sp. HCB337]|uniref:polysaccharide deacetylase family protein n=1 Tax=Bdellovibrio sp. HCB337 TaxID=3394358 RepID=UPI0039A59F08